MAEAAKLIASGLSTFGSVSPDGLLISYTDAAGDLMLREVHSGKEERLTVRFANSTAYAGASVLSRDSRWIAFAWRNEDLTLDLRVVEIDSLDPRVIYRDPLLKTVYPFAWSANRQHVLALLGRDVAMVSLEEGKEPRRLYRFDERPVSQVAISADEQWLAHDAGQQVMLVELASGRERVMAGPAAVLPFFSFDGRSLFWQREGKLWRAAVAGGGEATVEREPFAPARPWGLTQRGELFHTLFAEKTEIFTLPRDNAGPPERMVTRFPGANREPVWGPDGRLVYWSRRGAAGQGALVVRDLTNNDERELTPKLAPIDWVGWTGNGKALLVAGLEPRQKKRGWYRVDAASGAHHEIFADPEFAAKAVSPAFLTADGRALIYARDGEVRIRDLEKRTERPVAVGQRFAVSPNGRSIAVAEAARVVIYSGPAFSDTVNVELPGITELSWSGLLLAGKAPQLWTIDALTGTARVVRTPRNRLAGASAHPAGDRIAMAAGQVAADLYAVQLAVR